MAAGARDMTVATGAMLVKTGTEEGDAMVTSSAMAARVGAGMLARGQLSPGGTMGIVDAGGASIASPRTSIGCERCGVQEG